MDNTDDELISRYLDGDEKAFEELYNRYRLKIFNFIFSLVKDNEAANDIFQEVFIKIINKLPTYENKNFKSMIFLIARNSVIDFLKNKKNRIENQKISMEKSIDDSHTIADTLSSADNPEKELMGNYDRKMLYDSISTLSEDYQEIIFMKHFSGLSFDEISKILNIPTGTLLSRFKRATDRLRKQLNQ